MRRITSVSAVVALVGAGVVWALLRFNQAAASYNQYILGNLVALFFVPMLTIVMFFREDFVKFGFGKCQSKGIWILTGVLFAGMLVILVIISKWPVFQSYYPFFRRWPEFYQAFAQYPRANPFFQAPMLMLYAEASYGLYLFFWEFFFRGYLLFGLSRSIGWLAVIVQAVAFGLLHFGKPWPELASSFVGGIILGIVAIRGKSFLPCFVLHWATSVSLDLLIVAGRPH